MKIGLFSISSSELNAGKQAVKDGRLDQVDKITKAKKKTYLQVELVGEDALQDSDAILTHKDASTDLILKDLEFVENRLARSENEEEKVLLNKLKSALEKETFIFNMGLADSQQQAISGYGLLSAKAVIIADQQELSDLNTLFLKALREGGFISFFTTGEKETRAWLIKKGTTASEAAGVIHSDIQKGFIRAEIISFEDFIKSGGETPAKQAGKMRLEQKDYIMQDGDLVNFRFNK